MAALNVTLVAADGKIWEGEATTVIAPAAEGPLGILPGHAPVLAALTDGQVRIDSPGGTFSTMCYGGFVTVDDNVVTLAVDSADASPAQ